MAAVPTSGNQEATRILIVDDEQPIRNLLSRHLQDAGYQCSLAENAASARDLLARYRFDLILCDLDMPGESGLELFRYLKVHFPETGRVMVTSTDDSKTAKEILEVGVYGYILKPFNKNTLLITVQNALHHQRLDHDMAAYKQALEQKVWERTEKLTTINDTLNVGVIMFKPDMKVIEANRQIRLWFPGLDADPPKSCYQLFPYPARELPCEDCPVVITQQEGTSFECIKQLATAGGKRDFRIVTSPIHDKEGNIVAGMGLYVDITERLILEQELRQAQKIEAIGQLAAGITHEINTPIQYVGDNLVFMRDAFQDISRLFEALQKLYAVVDAGETVAEETKQAVAEAIEEADIEYLFSEIPPTIEQGLEGVSRVQKIVRAMKEFSHPGSDEKISASINELLESTVTISRNQWKYVAELETDFQPDLPMVPCFPGEINQVFFNIIVNAAHAIGELNKENGKLGKITITTRKVAEAVQIRIGDNGGGVPEAIRERIFEPFFTTKARGKGTGQGLAISRRVVVDKHAGSLLLETEQGKGSTFIIELPLQ